MMKAHNNTPYCSIAPEARPLSAKDINDAIIGLCFANNAERLLLEDGDLHEDFFALRTGFAGELLQKLTNYHIKAALVTTPERLTGRFGEMALETNKGASFRIFTEEGLALDWLCL